MPSGCHVGQRSPDGWFQLFQWDVQGDHFFCLSNQIDLPQILLKFTLRVKDSGSEGPRTGAPGRGPARLRAQTHVCLEVDFPVPSPGSTHCPGVNTAGGEGRGVVQMVTGWGKTG